MQTDRHNLTEMQRSDFTHHYSPASPRHPTLGISHSLLLRQEAHVHMTVIGGEMAARLLCQ